MRTAQTVIDWLGEHEGWSGDRYCIQCRELLLMDITPIGFDPETGERLHRRKGVCPRAGRIFGSFLHTTDGRIIPPRPWPPSSPPIGVCKQP
jgi:hypothetical protein